MLGHVDGNALAGAMYGVFRTDITVARGECRNCGDIAPIATGMLYNTDMGAVLRCRNCGNVLLVAVTSGQEFSFNAQGLTSLRWEMNR